MKVTINKVEVDVPDGSTLAQIIAEQYDDVLCEEVSDLLGATTLGEVIDSELIVYPRISDGEDWFECEEDENAVAHKMLAVLTKENQSSPIGLDWQLHDGDTIELYYDGYWVNLYSLDRDVEAKETKYTAEVSCLCFDYHNAREMANMFFSGNALVLNGPNKCVRLEKHRAQNTVEQW